LPPTILYKVEIPDPGPQEFAEILRRTCGERNVDASEGTIERIVERLYGQPGQTPTAAYARDLLEMIVEGAAYDEQEPVLDEQTFERAFRLSMSQRDRGETI
jgi:hypothetical protein